jgi:hypothetical protein
MQKQAIEGIDSLLNKNIYGHYSNSIRRCLIALNVLFSSRENLNLQVLEEALQRVVNRHEILRTTFQYLPGMTIPLQVIHETSPLSIEQYDVSNLESSRRNDTIEALFIKNFNCH